MNVGKPVGNNEEYTAHTVKHKMHKTIIRTLKTTGQQKEFYTNYRYSVEW